MKNEADRGGCYPPRPKPLSGSTPEPAIRSGDTG